MTSRLMPAIIVCSLVLFAVALAYPDPDDCASQAYVLTDAATEPVECDPGATPDVQVGDGLTVVTCVCTGDLLPSRPARSARPAPATDRPYLDLLLGEEGPVKYRGVR